MMKLKQQVLYAAAGILAVGIAGSIGFYLAEGLGFFDALWLTVTSVLAVGYGDIVPATAEGKLFAMLIIPIGIMIVTYAAN